MLSEKTLIEKVKRGNKRAFKKLFNANINGLYQFLTQFSKDRDAIADWVQTAFIKAYLNINKFESNSKFSTWLFRIAINEMKSDFRSMARKNTFPLDNYSFLESRATNEDFDWHYDMKWLLDDLEEINKAVFILHDVENYKHSEISKILNISTESSRIILYRTKKILRERWLKETEIKKAKSIEGNN